ncbi:hypothetical protein [Psychrobacter phenylpyruvicus]|uniref:Uncharacterized protein n=1 Tax=Psychrobacter phenylpyruvicus TaxID=29432 RepID=A0A379LIH6_9GAMM|nr:hypothetical protein [Psychrobacter phenylpyruvicus]SUD90251.1 Uncharacterised protein [Psychrobacter phenylpyruvicus]
MQNEKPPSSSPDNRGTLKKWLPAIALALAIHALLLIVFFNSQKSASVDDSEVTTQASEATTDAEDLAHEKEVLLTLIEERTLTKKEEDSAESSAEDTNSDDSKDESKKEESAKSEIDTKAEEDSKQSEGNNGNSKDKKQSQKNVTQNNGQKQQNTSPPLDSSAYTPQPAINPNDAVLLPRDLPQVEHTPIIGNSTYANTAKQSQDISDQLSSAVNEIKEQKLREIEKQQQASREAYLKNQPASAQPEATKPATNSAN